MSTRSDSRQLRPVISGDERRIYLLQRPEFMFMTSDSNVSSEFPRNGKVHLLVYLFVIFRF